MTIFASIGISGSGIAAAQTWINTNAGNLANMNDTGPTNQPAYAQETPVFVPVGSPGAQGTGVVVSGIALGSSAGVVVPDPSSPLADAQGNVRVPDIQLGGQLVGMIEAQNSYEANVSALSHATTAYRAALTLGS